MEMLVGWNGLMSHRQNDLETPRNSSSFQGPELATSRQADKPHYLLPSVCPSMVLIEDSGPLVVVHAWREKRITECTRLEGIASLCASTYSSEMSDLFCNAS
jgi:hypothetical protein